jgi:hypothetical protein
MIRRPPLALARLLQAPTMMVEPRPQPDYHRAMIRRPPPALARLLQAPTMMVEPRPQPDNL